MDLAAELRTAELTLDDHMLYTIFIDALRAKYEVEARSLYLVTVWAAMTSSRLHESGTTDFLEAGRSVPTPAMPAMLCSPGAAVVAAEEAAATVPTGKVEATAREKNDVGDIKDKAVKAPTRRVVARPRLLAAMAEPPKPPKVVPPRLDDTGVARRANEGWTARRTYADVTDGGTLLMSAPRRMRNLCWRHRTTMMTIWSRLQLSRPKRQASPVMFWTHNGGRGIGLAGRE